MHHDVNYMEDGHKLTKTLILLVGIKLETRVEIGRLSPYFRIKITQFYSSFKRNGHRQAPAICAKSFVTRGGWTGSCERHPELFGVPR